MNNVSIPSLFEGFSPLEQAAVLAYLNLPPVGGFADVDGPPNPALNDGCELPASLRAALRPRRERLGKFSSAADFDGIDGFGPADMLLLQNKVREYPRFGNRVRPVWGGPEGEREFFALLESAERYIHIYTFILGGDVGMRVAELLARKMQEGVEVRLMFCASGFVISGSPSGTGFVSRWSALRSWAVNDMYVRKRLVRYLDEHDVPYLNNVPIGRHWYRKSFRDAGVKSAAAYERFMRDRGIPDAWLNEQARIDAESGASFANVDHRKMVIVDGDRAFIGSQNIADSYFYANELDPDPAINVRNWQWHDNSAVLEGPAVSVLSREFAARWMLLGGDRFDWEDSFYTPPPRPVGTAVVNVVSSIPGALKVPFKANFGRIVRSFFGADARPLSFGDHPIRSRVLQLPALAASDFYVEHCYPSDSALLEHWARLAPSVKDFTMVVPFHYDTKVLGMECDRMYPELLRAGIRLAGYERAIVHSKIAVVDGWYTAAGSYNLTLRSARADLETEFFIQCAEYGGAVRRLIEQDMTLSSPVKPTLAHRFRSRFSLPVFDAVVRYFIL